MPTPKQESPYFQRFVAPVIVAVIVGAGSGYLATRDATLILDQQVKAIAMRLDSLNAIVEAVKANQIELAARGEWMRMVESHIEATNSTLSLIQRTRYTDKDAARDMQLIRMEIEQLREAIQANRGQ